MQMSTGKALASARLDGTKLAADMGPPPNSLEQAYALQDEMIDAIGVPLVGWKIGATNAEIQGKLGTDGPLYGPLFDRWIYPGPTRIPTPNGARNVVEVEVAFRLKDALPSRESAYSQDEVAAAIGSVHPAIEIVDSRFQNTDAPIDFRWIIADGAANHAFIFGEGRSDWQSLNLAELPVSVRMGDIMMGEGTGANALGNPLAALTWLTEALRQRDIGLKAGDWISTGALAPVFEGRRGVQITGHFKGLGQVEMVLA